MDSVTNGVVITDAIKFVQQKKKELSSVNDNSYEGQSTGVRNSSLGLQLMNIAAKYYVYVFPIAFTHSDTWQC
jgi:hypothetical protein